MLGRSRKRHIAKAITWRLVGSIDTIIISWIITENPWMGLKIGLAEIGTKMILYYLHERVWFKINLTNVGIITENSKVRHIVKAITWRVVGTIDTMVLAWIITGSPLAGFKIGMFEFLTKTIFYYIHERVWYRVNYGLRE